MPKAFRTLIKMFNILRLLYILTIWKKKVFLYRNSKYTAIQLDYHATKITFYHDIAQSKPKVFVWIQKYG